MLIVRRTRRFLSLSLFVLAAVVVGAAGGAVAQGYAVDRDLGQPAMQAFDAAADSLLALVPIRDVSEIQSDMNAAQAQRAEGEMRLQRAMAIKARSEMRIRLKQSELDAVKSRLDLAKKEKDEVRKLDLEGQKKQAELEKKLLERRADLRSREVEHAKATGGVRDGVGPRLRRGAEAGRQAQRARRIAAADPVGVPVDPARRPPSSRSGSTRVRPSMPASGRPTASRTCRPRRSTSPSRGARSSTPS